MRSSDNRLTYTIADEAWWWRSANRKDFYVIIEAQREDGGVPWGFEIEQSYLPKVKNERVLRLKMIDEAWVAWEEIPEFFTGLRALEDGAGLRDVVKLLDRIGAVDVTVRQHP